MRYKILIGTFFCFVFFVQSVHAGLILLNAGDISWDRGTSPGGSPTITIPIAEGGAGAQNKLFAFTFGLKFSGGTAGSLTISNPVNPAVDPLFATQAPARPAATPQGGGITLVTGENNVVANEAPGIAGDNAVTFNFTSTDALGVFNLLFDSGTSSFVVAPEGLDPPVFDEPFDNANDFLISTITVTNSLAAVPEPSTAILAAVPLLGFFSRRVRKKFFAVKKSDC